MGSHHSHQTHPKAPDKPAADTTDITTPTRAKVVCNTPYLTALFKRMSELSRDIDPSLGEDDIHQSVLEDNFNGPLKVLGKLLFYHIRGYDVKRICIHLDEFLEVASQIMGITNSTQQLNYYFDVFSEHKDFMDIEDAYRMVQASLYVSLSAAYLPYERSVDHPKYLRALATSIMGPNQKLSKEEFIKWCSKHIPNIFNGVHCFILIKLSGTNLDSDGDWHKRLSQGNCLESGAISDNAVSMLNCVDSNSTCLSYCLLWILSNALPARYMSSGQKAANGPIVPIFLISKLQQLAEHNAWSLLYNSDQDGLSANRFEHHTFSYKGPTVTFIEFDNNLYLLATDQEWRESQQLYGGDDTMLIQLLPRFGLVDSGKMVYLNHHTRGVFKGIQVGTNPKSPVLKIKEMSTVIHYGVELALQHIEVWGCAGAEARSLQLRQKAWELKEVEKIQNKKLQLENWEDNPDRMLLNWAGIQTEHAEKSS